MCEKGKRGKKCERGLNQIVHFVFIFFFSCVRRRKLNKVGKSNWLFL